MAFPRYLHLNCFHYAVGIVSDCRSKGHKFESYPGHITFVEIDHEITSAVGHFHPSVHSRRAVVSYKANIKSAIKILCVCVCVCERERERDRDRDRDREIQF